MGKFLRNRTYRNYLVKCPCNMGNSLAKIDCSIYNNLVSDCGRISFHIVFEYSDTPNITKHRHIKIYLWFNKKRIKYDNRKILVHSKSWINLGNIETPVLLILEAIYYWSSNYSWDCCGCYCLKSYHKNHHDFDS